MSAPIDEKDEPGKYRAGVRHSIEQRFGVGTRLSDSSAMVGNWDASFDRSYAQLPPKPFCIYEFQKNGKCTIGVVGGAIPPGEGTWRVNPDGTFTILHVVPPDPTVTGLENGAIEEVRQHAMLLSDGRCVLWNGDASVVQVLTKVAGESGPVTED